MKVDWQNFLKNLLKGTRVHITKKKWKIYIIIFKCLINKIKKIEENGHTSPWP